MQEFDGNDVEKALWEIDDNKPPGVDGFSAAFFKHSWNVIGDQIIKVVLNFFWNGRMMHELNSTVIYLIPKTDNPSTPAE